mmetsp:Transcript_5786/g.14110  ORF Transcript_5786/g.14110 Transcript_5786/m.14110 type:complete len:303 (+) Transcript_5786:154-1062(+)
MIRAASATFTKRVLARTSAGSSSGSRLHAAPLTASFHSSAPRWEEKKEGEVAPAEGGGGINPLFAIPLGVAFGVPVLTFQWFIPNEETLLASTFLGFCVIAYTQGGELMASAFKEESKAMLKAQNDAEDAVIEKMEETVEYMKLTENIVEDYKGVLDLTEQSYEKLNKAGTIKPQHDLKHQMEKMLAMVSAEETNAYEKAKVAMMSEATDVVTASFMEDKDLKKAALDDALAKLVGKGGGADPVQAAFVSYFQGKAKSAKASDDGLEQKEARAAMLAKMNAIAENDGMFFRFDESGKPKMVA